MSTLLKNVTNCIWHAFDSLQNNEVVHKSKLKYPERDLCWEKSSEERKFMGHPIMPGALGD
ncbi:hypothetical protein RR46_11397 [Papilio xuthus]|uniref:Uncharacterized protein n=1 Tax=Papilio xuthus TaxID=66420 RepID=A0A194PSF1_PAPXU|nr:hypothetical protein RR46_11397 [Papilio xuthus]